MMKLVINLIGARDDDETNWFWCKWRGSPPGSSCPTQRSSDLICSRQNHHDDHDRHNHHSHHSHDPLDHHDHQNHHNHHDHHERDHDYHDYHDKRRLQN